MTQPTLIGITGHAGHGKDSVRAALAQHHGYVGLALADPIRAMLRGLLVHCNIPTGWMTERELKELPIDGIGYSYRQMAQELGTEWGRNLDPDLWLIVAQRHIQGLRLHGARHLCVSDVRFANEAAWVRQQGGMVWRVERPGVAAVRPHTSESDIEHIRADVVIDNSGTLADLSRRVAAALGSLA